MAHRAAPVLDLHRLRDARAPLVADRVALLAAAAVAGMGAMSALAEAAGSPWFWPLLLMVGVTAWCAFMALAYSVRMWRDMRRERR
jgi:fatty acid desaturase